jgi:hypothetical protein
MFLLGAFVLSFDMMKESKIQTKINAVKKFRKMF